MGWLKDIGGGLVGGAMDLGFDWLSNETIGKPNMREAYRHADNNSAKAFERSYDAYKNRYQTSVLDMKKAGLNPILAATGGFQVGGQPSAQVNAAIQPPPPTGEGTYSARNLGETSVSRAEVQEKIEKVAEIRENAALLQQRARQERIRTRTVVPYEEAKIQKEISLLDTQVMKTFSNHLLLKAQAATEPHIRKRVQAQRKLLLKQINQLQYQLQELRRTSQVYRKPIGGWLKYIRAITDALGIKTIIPIGVRGGR
jgi:hypothetical protein